MFQKFEALVCIGHRLRRKSKSLAERCGHRSTDTMVVVSTLHRFHELERAIRAAK
jgi:hypothetical protein